MQTHHRANSISILIDLHITDNLDSSRYTNLAVDANGSGIRNILGSLVYYAFDARQGSFVSGAPNFTLRLDWISSTGETQAGISDAKIIWIYRTYQ